VIGKEKEGYDNRPGNRDFEKRACDRSYDIRAFVNRQLGSGAFG